VLVDFSGVLTVEEAARRIQIAYRDLRGPVARAVAELASSLSLTLKLGPAAASASAVRAEALDAVSALLDLPLKVLERTGAPTFVVFDEFQAVLEVPGLDGTIRSRIQHHGPAAAYVFAGSEPSLMRSLFEDRARPLYGQARPHELGPLPPEPTLTAIRTRFEATNRTVEAAVAERLVAAGAGHPQRTMLLAHSLWAQLGAGERAAEEHLERALHVTLRQLGGEYGVLWDGANRTERRVLAALSLNLSPTSTREGAQVGVKPSSAQKAIASLARNGIIRRSAGTRWEIVDPLLPLWLRETVRPPGNDR
jgi:hypothetical protein